MTGESMLRVDEERVLALEARYPNLKFQRIDGQILGWGSVPEQATGTIDGNPFYYRYRGNLASLRVWDKKRFSIDDVPCLSVFPILASSIDGWATGEGSEWAGSSYGIELFVALFEQLSAPALEDTYAGRLAELVEEYGAPTAGEVQEELAKILPEAEFLEREAGWEKTNELFVQFSAATVRLSWDCAGYPSTVRIAVYSSDQDVLRDAKTIAFGDYMMISDPPTLPEAIDIAQTFVSYFPEVEWDHAASYSNHWDPAGLALYAMFTSKRDDLRDRYTREYEEWVSGVKETLEELQKELG